MAKLIEGDRVGKSAVLMTGCSALIYDDRHEKILLTRRTDNGRWCLPGGAMEAGECCAREVWEETGLRVQVGRLIAVYSTPHRIVEYADGNRRQIIGHSFEAVATGGKLSLSADEMAALDIMEHHRERIADALLNRPEAIVK